MNAQVVIGEHVKADAPSILFRQSVTSQAMPSTAAPVRVNRRIIQGAQGHAPRQDRGDRLVNAFVNRNRKNLTTPLAFCAISIEGWEDATTSRHIAESIIPESRECSPLRPVRANDTNGRTKRGEFV
jgi:hypothetical protein